MKTLFISSGPIQWGSSRMRCYWPAEYMNADVVQFSEVERTGNYPADYDAAIFQKYANPHIARQYLDAGVQTWWDLCDPLHWFSPAESAEIARNVTGIVTSNEGLTADVIQWLAEQGISVPVHTIPDRFELTHITNKREHKDVSPVRLVWYGVSVNRVALYGAVANLDRLAANGYKIELSIVDDRPEVPLSVTNSFPVYHTRWSLENEIEIISSHDIALLPSYSGPWGKVKSTNKRDLANLCGLPYWDGMNYEMGRKFVTDYKERTGPDKSVWPELDVLESARDWNRLFDENRNR